MIIYETKEITEEHKIGKTLICDVCKKEFCLDTDDEQFDMDFLEIQEFVNITHRCGYGSVFGDEDTIKINICQHCLKEKLGEFIRIEEDW